MNGSPLASPLPPPGGEAPTNERGGGERILVGVSSSPSSVQLLGVARRLAEAAHSPWTALYVETPVAMRLGAAARHRVSETLQLAERTGAEIATIPGESAATEMVRYARAHGVTRIVIGKPTHSVWKDWPRRSFLEEIVRSSTGIDVYAVSGETTAALPSPSRAGAQPKVAPGRSEDFLQAAAIAVVATSAAFLAFGRDRLADTVMVQLLGIIVVAMRFGQGPSILATVLSVLLVDFFFVPPYFSFAVSDFQHVVTFGVMFVVAVVISSLTQRIRDHAHAAALREQRTANLYGLTRELARTRATTELARVSSAHLRAVFDARVALYLASSDGTLAPVPAPGPLSASSSGSTNAASFVPDARDRVALDWTFHHDAPSGLTTGTLPATEGLYLPLRETRGCIGVLGLLPADPTRFADPEQRALLDVFAAQIASALERGRLADEAERILLQVETERHRNALLSSVSHDLRTPLAVITGAASALVEPAPGLSETARRDLTETIHEEAERLNRLVHNLLEMTRIASGALKVNKEWQPFEEVVGAVLNRLESMPGSRSVDLELAPSLPLVPIDAVLIEQVLINLLENAAKYTPPDSPLTLSAVHEPPFVVVSLADRGPGIPAAERERIFEKFHRLRHALDGGRAGLGLGLAISRSIVTVHGGSIRAEEREGGGAVFRFTIPIEGEPPTPWMEDAR